jgi:serine/threonine-protein kinase
VHDLGVLPDGRPFLAMKLIKGETLEVLLKHRADPAEGRGQFVAAFEQVSQAVAYAHAHGVIHRDLKPANVMVGAFGEVQVMDWGLAKVLGGRPEEGTDQEETTAGTAVRSMRDSDDLFTEVGSVLGTPAFMAPEQAAGAVGTINRRSDVFGLGAVLAVVLTGRPPFAGEHDDPQPIGVQQPDGLRRGATDRVGHADQAGEPAVHGHEHDRLALLPQCLDAGLQGTDIDPLLGQQGRVP